MVSVLATGASVSCGAYDIVAKNSGVSSSYI